MYLPFYGLAEKPFSITPDPRYLYLGGRHAEALAHLLYGVTDAGGFIQLTGEVGTGKTTMIRSLLARRPDNVDIALIINPSMNVEEFVLTICEELGILLPDDAVGSMKDLTGILNRHLLRAHAQGRRVVLIVDEAQNLSPALLEQVRLLTNLETETSKLLQIILIGQPELREMLARNDLRQLAQRITGRYHLDPLSREETAAYVRHRLRIAGATQEIFGRGALNELYRTSGGIPRLINVIGDRALLGGFTEDRHQLGPALVRRAAGEVFGHSVQPAWLPWSAALVGAVLLTAGTWYAWSRLAVPTRPEAQVASIAATAAEATTAPADPTIATATNDADQLQAAQLPQEPALTGPDAAWSQLFGLWGVQYLPGGEEACAQALRQGLECLAFDGGLATLRPFNRPAILPLEDEDGILHQAVLAQFLDDGEVALLIDGTARQIPLQQLEQQWDGSFVLLWKPAQLDTRNLALGMWGEPVRNLRIRLNAWAGIAEPPVEAPDYFDQMLHDLVVRFQAEHGLVVDGIAGAHTQAVLDAALAGPGTPLLSGGE